LSLNTPVPRRGPDRRGPARPRVRPEPREKRDKKQASEILKKAAWTTDYDKALEESKKSGKPIFGYFSRSYSP
jgi:hypothetical protein